MNFFFLFLICMALYTNTSAQIITKDSIVGSYHFSTNGKLFIYSNNRYVYVFFGALVNGEWKLKNDTVHFIPDYEPDSFILYGRKTTTLKDSVRIIFEDFGKDDNPEFSKYNPKYINLESFPKNSILNMRQVFNDDANCFSFYNPYIYKGIEAIQKLRFAIKQEYSDENTEHDVYTFDNLTAYNDFVVVANRHTKNAPFSAIVKNGGLVLDTRGLVTKKKEFNEPLNEEELFFESLTSQKIFADTMYCNKEHFSIDLHIGFEIGYYQYDKTNDLYFNPDLEKAKKSSEFDYHKSENSELLPYKRMTKLNVQKQAIKIDKNPLFIAKCN